MPNRVRADNGSAEERIALVAESDRAVGKLIRTLLVRAGFCVITAHSGRDAIRLCRETNLPIAVAVLEVELPDMAGVELMMTLRSDHPGIRVVFVGADAQDERLRGCPPGPLLTKPFHPDELLRLVSSVGLVSFRGRELPR
jgi:two-component system, cell cycle sensor histidine kinase and response regulator CckA